MTVVYHTKHLEEIAPGVPPNGAKVFYFNHLSCMDFDHFETTDVNHSVLVMTGVKNFQIYEWGVCRPKKCNFVFLGRALVQSIQL